MDMTIDILPALAVLALLAADPMATPPRSAPGQPLPAAAVSVPDSAIGQSADARYVADWIAASGDNRALPYAIVDKRAASLALYDAAGRLLGQVPVLVGIAPGDEATPGVGSKTLGEIGPAEKTTPAGRFLTRFGYAAGRQSVLWVDYANSVAIHPIPADAAKAERRADRLLSPPAEDNRITFGCINVPRRFYGEAMRPTFRKKGGYVYVLPDTRPLEEVFPRLRVHALTARAAAS